jgi:hypothetical protein
MSMIPPTTSLVRYDNPALVTRNNDKRNAKSKGLKSSSPTPMDGILPISGQNSDQKSKNKLQPIDSKSFQQTDEILNSILPPRFVLY